MFITKIICRIQDTYFQEWGSNVRYMSSARLFKYIEDFWFEPYLDQLDRTTRVATTKIRLSSHIFNKYSIFKMILSWYNNFLEKYRIDWWAVFGHSIDCQILSLLCPNTAHVIVQGNVIHNFIEYFFFFIVVGILMVKWNCFMLEAQIKEKTIILKKGKR